jgi:type IV pilus assembly protein PilW
MALIEFMIALTIGMVLTLGMLMLMSSTSRSYKINDEFSRMQENGSTALRFLGDDIRMAGFYGLAISTDKIEVRDTLPADGFLDYGQDAGINFGITAANDCGAANWSLQPNVPIIGLGPATDGTAANAALPCIPVANYLTGPAIVLRGAVGTMVNRDNAGQPINFTSAQLDPNTLYLQTDPFMGFFFIGSDYDNYKAATLGRSIDRGAIVDAPIYAYQTHIYYLRPCSRPTGTADSRGNPTCQASDDGGRPIPTLARQELQAGAGGPIVREVGLVEGVEQMTVFYGIDNLSRGGLPVGCELPVCANGPDGIADMYTAAPADLTAWSRVVMVRLNLLLRASAPTPGHDDSSKSYDLGGAVAWNCVAAGAPCNYKRHIFSQQIQVRNIAGRRSG